MALVRWDPFRTLRLFGDFATPEEGYGAWVPPVDIFERGDALVIRAELPGVNREDIATSAEAARNWRC